MRAGDEAAQTLQITGDATAIEAGHLHLHHLGFFFLSLQLLPALAQGQGANADGHHAIGVLLAGDQHLQLKSLGETLLEIGDHSKSTFFFGHEARRFAADIHINAVALQADHHPLHHLAGGTNTVVFIEGGEESLLVKVEFIDGARGGAGWGSPGWDR